MNPLNEAVIIVIGIGGGSASGKSSLAQAFETELERSCALLSQDDYYLPTEQPAGTNFDHPDCIDWSLFTDHVRELAAGRSVLAPSYDFSMHARGAPIAHRPASLLLIEGLHVLTRPEMRAMFHLGLFVEAPADLRIIRRIRRDVAERGRTLESVLDQYERQVRPMHTAFVEPSRRHADLLVDGTRSSSDIVAYVKAFARARGLTL